MKRFADLTAVGTADAKKDANTARVVCTLYPRWIATRRNPHTLKIRTRVFVPFTDALGEVPMKGLTQHAVYAWLDGMREWRTHPGTGYPTRRTTGACGRPVPASRRRSTGRPRPASLPATR